MVQMKIILKTVFKMTVKCEEVETIGYRRRNDHLLCCVEVTDWYVIMQ